jgi:hypothetical protein
VGNYNIKKSLDKYKNCIFIICALNCICAQG